MSRMKQNYESRSTQYLTRKIPVIMRVDGKAFHTYTSNLNKPFDDGLISDMNNTAIYLCQNIQGAKCAYVQSDEISILITDYDNLQTDAWFDYNVQKMCSISAGYASGKFNQLRFRRLVNTLFLRDGQNNFAYWMDHLSGEGFDYIYKEEVLANFDSRVWNHPKEEVANYFLARQKDCVKNSIAAVAQSLYSHKELEGKNQSEQQEFIFQKGLNWNNFEVGKKRGRFIVKNTYVNKELSLVKDNKVYLSEPYDRWVDITKEDTVITKWEVVETPETFNQEHFNLFI